MRSRLTTQWGRRLIQKYRKWVGPLEVGARVWRDMEDWGINHDKGSVSEGMLVPEKQCITEKDGRENVLQLSPCLQGRMRSTRWRWQCMCPWCRCIRCVSMHIHIWPDPPSPPTVILHPVTHAHALCHPNMSLPTHTSGFPSPFHMAQPPFTHLSSHPHVLGPTNVPHPPPTCVRPHLDMLGAICMHWSPLVPPGPHSMSHSALPCSPFPAPFTYLSSHLCTLAPTDVPDVVT